MHHSQQPIEEIAKLFEERDEAIREEAIRLQLGETGRFPEGKIVDHDEGELKSAITTYKGKVIVSFGKPVAFVGLTAKQAVEFADILKKHALDLMNPNR